MLNMHSKEFGYQVPKYKEAFSDHLGRYLVAGKTLLPGESILREKPVVAGPAAFNKNLLCFNCLRLTPNISIDETKFRCKNCGIAILCGSICEDRRFYHTREECELFKVSMNLKDLTFTELNIIILPLRLWLLRKTDIESWNKIAMLEAHLKERKNSQVWQECQINVINVLKKVGIIGPNDDDDDLLQKICGIIDVNSFELRSPGTIDNSFLRGLYSEAALMTHDCRGNTHLTVDDDFNLSVYASVPIREGQPILFNYTSSLLGTLERRKFLRVGKYFDCTCPMCQHPDELGAHLSSIICPRCKTGFLGLKDLSIYNAFVREKIWLCRHCDKLYSGKLLKTTFELAECQINKTNHSSSKDLEKLIKDLTRTFHPHHSLLLHLKQELLRIYRNDAMTIQPQRKILERILELCKEFMEVLEIVEPGISRLKGIILYEMHLPLVLLANQAYTSREIVSTELAHRLEDALNILKRSLSMLLLEPVTTPEGMLAKRALQEYQILRGNLEDAKSLPQESQLIPIAICEKSSGQLNVN